MEPILVTGVAGGPQGSTGRHVAQLLLDRGLPVRAFVHSDDARAAELRSLGAEVVIGDLREIATVLPAVRGVRRAFFTYPVIDGLLEATGAFAAAARQEGLERVVDVSQLAAAPDGPTPRMRQHWVAEQVLDWAGVGAVHLRAAVFFENMASLIGPGRALALPLGSTRTIVPLVGGTDVARVAAGVLATADDVPAVCLLTGDVLDVGQIVETFSSASGGEVTYVDVPPDDWPAQALAAGLDPHAITHLSKLWEIFRILDPSYNLFQVTESIQQLGGQAPQTLREFANRGGY